MIILAIDTVAERCAACVYDAVSDDVLGRVSLELGKGHAERLMDVIAETLQQAGKIYADLDRIAVAVGPGSFMGIRTGVSVACGLALALGVPAVGVTALEAIAAEARGQHPNRPVLAAIDARRGEVYAALHGADGAEQQPAVADAPEHLAKSLPADAVLAGSGAPLIAAALSDQHRDFGPLSATAEIATYARLGTTKPVGEKPKPFYLRAPDAKPQTGFALPRRSG